MAHTWKCNQFMRILQLRSQLHVTTEFSNISRCGLHSHRVPVRHNYGSISAVISYLEGATSQRRNCLAFDIKHDRIVQTRGLQTNSQSQQRVISNSVSTHLPSIKQIEQFLSSKNVSFEHGHTSIIAQCSFCSKKKGVEPEMTMYINKTTGSHFCKNCGTSGSWRQFKIIVSANHNINTKTPMSDNPLTTSSGESEKAAQLWDETQPLTKCEENYRNRIIDKFSIKSLSEVLLDKYQVHVIKHKFSEPDGSVKERLCVAFPWYDSTKLGVRGIKLVQVDQDSGSEVTLQPRQGFLGLFGWNTVQSDAKEIVLTLNEFDAIAVNQSTYYPAISLPLGTHSLPPEVLPQLEQFQRIILWFGSDVRSKQAANQFSRKLNIQRCYFLRPFDKNAPTGALDALNKGLDLQELITSAQPVSHEKIATFHQLRNEVYGELINADQVAGVKWSRFPKLNAILKGHRRGELTIFTGPTGAGKTTLLSEMSLDLCHMGVNTLWGSFEIRNVRLIKIMLNQFSGINLQRNIQQYNYWADKFEMLPMYFMCFYGSQNINTVVETMAHAAYVYDIDHIIIDNLQFMTSNLRSDDRYSVHNHVIGAFRDFASSKNVHVTLVIHPRKENDDVELQTASIFGTAKAAQEADNVLILQDKKGRGDKYLQVTKNRFDGTLGRVPLEFVKDSSSLSGFGKLQSGLKKTRTTENNNSQFKATRVVADIDVINVSGPTPIGKAAFSLPRTKPHSPGNMTSSVSKPEGADFTSGNPRTVSSPGFAKKYQSSQGGLAHSKVQSSYKKGYTDSQTARGSLVSASKLPRTFQSLQGRVVSLVKKASGENRRDGQNGSPGDKMEQKTTSAVYKTKRLAGTKLHSKAISTSNKEGREKGGKYEEL